jgi:Ca-activated chloride channel family protein
VVRNVLAIPPVVGVAVLLAAASVSAQQPTPAAGAFVDRTEVSAVLIPVTVRDRKGRPVATLEQNRFHLFVDGIEFPIQSFWREGGLPLSLAFVLDTSGSMGTRRLGKAREVILAFASQLRQQDEVCLITFGGGEVKRRLPFGVDPSLLPRILEPLRGYGTTALYDVLTAAPEIMKGAHHIRRAILLFTDGVDTASKLSAADALRVMQDLSDPLYAFGIEPPPDLAGRRDTYDALLERFAAASGGRYVRVDDVSKLPALGQELRRELTMRYIIDVEPSGVGEAKPRSIQVRVDGNFQVQARRGYVGTLP